MNQGLRDCRKDKRIEDSGAASNEEKHWGEPGKLDLEEVVVGTYLYERFPKSFKAGQLTYHHDPGDHSNMAQYRQEEDETSTARFSKIAPVDRGQQSRDCTKRKLLSDHCREQVLYRGALA